MPTTSKLTQQEKEACILLSDLFLDTDVTLFIEYISSSLRELEIPVSKAEQILQYDVFPVLFPNFLCVAGEWAGFDEDLLISEVEAGRSWGLNPFRWIWKVFAAVAWYTLGAYIVWPYWVQVKQGMIDGSEKKL